MSNTFYYDHRCIFDAATHTYTLVDAKTGEAIKTLKSVTRLIREQGLAPDYSMVDPDVLNTKAERLTLIHREIEEYIKYGEIGMTSEMQDFVRLCKENSIDPVDSEFIVYDENYAGTVDILAKHGDVNVFADNKTSATLHKASLQWQLSIYATLARKMGYDVDALAGFHLNNNSKFMWIDEVPGVEIEKLFKADFSGAKYEQRAIVVNPDMLAQIIEFDEIIANLEAQKKAAQTKYDELKAALLEAMKKNGVKTYDSDRVKITYVEATTRESVDTKALKADMPDVYTKYRKTTAVKDTVKITVRGLNE